MSAPTWERVIVHADMDAFFAAVEELDEPALRGKPMVVGGTSPRSVVATANYAARRFGIGSAMPMAHAQRRCRQLIIRRPRFERYQEISRIVMAVFRSLTPTIEPLSLDEAFLDLTERAGEFASPAALGHALKAAVKAATGGLTVSVGVASNKFVAKVASDLHKPDGLTVVEPDRAREFLAPLPVSRLWGAGPITTAKLGALGFETMGDVAGAAPERLASLGKAGRFFWGLARAEDAREVTTGRARKSVGYERTLSHDIVGAAAILPHLEEAAAEVGRRLERSRKRARGVRVKLKTARFRLVTRQGRMTTATRDAELLFGVATRLLSDFELTEPVRLVGLSSYDLVPEHQGGQLDLFADGPPGMVGG